MKYKFNGYWFGIFLIMLVDYIGWWFGSYNNSNLGHLITIILLIISLDNSFKHEAKRK